MMPMTRTATKERGSLGGRAEASARAAEPARSSSTGDRRIGQGGHRLAAAFDKVSALPALEESRRRLLSATTGAAASGDEVASTIESDAGLAIQVMRAANNGGGPHG